MGGDCGDGGLGRPELTDDGGVRGTAVGPPSRAWPYIGG